MPHWWHQRGRLGLDWVVKLLLIPLCRLQAEVDEVIGVKREIMYEDLGKFQYLSQVRLKKDVTGNPQPL